ncbi:hypothetical protein V1519DRAFT_225913 [Lipomyces tetrasporus]
MYQRYDIGISSISPTALEVRIEKWFEEYSLDAREYAFEHLHLTAAPNNSQPRCPNTISDSDYACTHFFKPAVKYATLHDARLVTLYHAISIGIAYLQFLTFPFAYLDFEDSLVPNAGKFHLHVKTYLDNEYGSMLDSAGVICRSVNHIVSHASNGAILNMMFPFHIAYYVIQDPLERGWIWNELRRMSDMGIPISLADINSGHEEWQKFKSLDVCPGCGEHIRQGMHSFCFC